MKQYNKDISFLSLLMKTIRPFILLLFFSMFIVQFGSMYFKLSNLSYKTTYYGTQYFEETDDYEEAVMTVDNAPSFRQCLFDCHYEALFIIQFVAICIVLILAKSIRKMHNNSEYTTWRIPISNRRQFYLTCIHNLLVLLMSVGIEIITILLSYLMYRSMVDETYQLYNQLFQTYITTGFLRFLLPATTPLFGVIVLLFYCLLAFLISCMSIGINNKNYAAVILSCFAIFIAYRALMNATMLYSFMVLVAFLILFLLVGIKSIHSNQYGRLNNAQIHRKEVTNDETQISTMAP